jgi:hypothetical protein
MVITVGGFIMRKLIFLLFFLTACFPKFANLDVISKVEQIEFENTWWELDNILAPEGACMKLSTYDYMLYVMDSEQSYRLTEWYGTGGVYHLPEYKIDLFVYFVPETGYTILAEQGILKTTSRTYACEID